MQIHALEAFEAVARLGSLTQAARHLHLTQPSISARLRTLEEEIGTQLFDRIGSHLQLSPAGEALLPFATQALKAIAGGKEAIDRTLDNAHQGCVKIGAIPTLCIHIVPRIVELWHRSHRFSPYAQVVVRAAVTAELVAMLLKQEIDLALTSKRPLHPRLREEAVLVDVISFLVPKGHVLDRVDVATPRDLHGQHVLHFQRTALNWQLSEFVCDGGTEWHLNPLFKSDHVEMAKRVRQMAGALAWGSVLAYQPELESGDMRTLEVEGVRRVVRQIFLVSRADDGTTETHGCFRSLCSELATQVHASLPR